MPAKRQPDPLAKMLGHIVVGGLVYLALRGRTNAGNTLILSLVSVGAHRLLDEPVSRQFSDLGI
jgi:hypothetical protein